MSVKNYGKIAVVRSRLRQVWETYRARLITTGQEEGCYYIDSSHVSFRSNGNLYVWVTGGLFGRGVDRAVDLPRSGAEFYFTGGTAENPYKFSRFTMEIFDTLGPESPLSISSENGSLNFTSISDMNWHTLVWEANDPSGDVSPRIRIVPRFGGYIRIDIMYVTVSTT